MYDIKVKVNIQCSLSFIFLHYSCGKKVWIGITVAPYSVRRWICIFTFTFALIALYCILVGMPCLHLYKLSCYFCCCTTFVTDI